MSIKARSSLRDAGKVCKITLWPLSLDASYKNFCTHIISLPGLIPGGPTDGELSIPGKPSEKEFVRVGAEHGLPFACGAKTSLTFSEIHYFDAPKRKELKRWLTNMGMDSDAVVLFGSTADTFGLRCELIENALDGTALFYVVPQARVDEGRKVLESLTNEKKTLVISATLADAANADEIKFLLQSIVGTVEGTIKKNEMDLSAPRSVSQITVVKGKDLMVADITGKSDPFCKIGFGPKFGTYKTGVHTTKAKKQTLNPVWAPSDKPTVKFDAEKLAGDTLWIEVWDEDLVGADRMGFCSIPVASLVPGEIELKVKPVKKEKACGSIWINVQ